MRYRPVQLHSRKLLVIQRSCRLLALLSKTRERAECQSLTELNDDFSEVIGVSCPGEEAYITDSALILRLAPEDILLNVGDRFQYEANSEENDSSNVPSCTECRLRKPSDIWRVEDCYR